MLNYRRLQILFLLFAVCLPLLPASAAECITKDCFFERVIRDACKNNPACRGNGRTASDTDTQLPANVVKGVWCPNSNWADWDFFVDVTTRAQGVCNIFHISQQPCLAGDPALRQRILSECERGKRNNPLFTSCVDVLPNQYCCQPVSGDKQACPVAFPPGTAVPGGMDRSCRAFCTLSADGDYLWGCGCLATPVP